MLELKTKPARLNIRKKIWEKRKKDKFDDRLGYLQQNYEK